MTYPHSESMNVNDYHELLPHFQFPRQMTTYPLVICYIAIEKIYNLFVDLPIPNGDCLLFFVLVGGIPTPLKNMSQLGS